MSERLAAPIAHRMTKDLGTPKCRSVSSSSSEIHADHTPNTRGPPNPRTSTIKRCLLTAAA